MNGNSSLPFRLFLLLIGIGSVSIMVMMIRTASLGTERQTYLSSWFHYVNTLAESWKSVEAVVIGNETVIYSLVDLPPELQELVDEDAQELAAEDDTTDQDIVSDSGETKREHGAFIEDQAKVSDCPALPRVPSYVKPFDGWIPVHRETIESKYKKKQPETGVNETHYLFQAYYDDRESRMVRVLTFSSVDKKTPIFYCQLWFTAPETGVTYNRVVQGEKKYLYRDCRHLYFPLMIDCQVGDNFPIPYAISIVFKRCAMPFNILMVVNTTAEPQRKDNVGICVKPMHGPYQSSSRLVEFIELYKMFGADHIMLYDYGHNKSLLLPIMKHYISRRTISLIPWSLPPSSKKLAVKRDPKLVSWIYRCGLIAAFTDCLYRSMTRFRYITFVDLDEFLVPRGNLSLKTMMRALPQEHSVYRFQERAFRIDWMPKSKALKAIKSDSRIFRYAPKTLMVTETETTSNSTNYGYIIKPKSAWAIRPNAPLLMDNSHMEFFAPTFLGQLHKYRFQDTQNLNAKPGREVDEYMWKYKDTLLSRIDMVFNKTRATVTN